MNIIQIQDRLKGMPKSSIVEYIKNPTGDVPTFLALGELQRRKDADEKYVAAQEPPATVAEQLIAENAPMGIGNMMAQAQPTAPSQGVGAPQPQPEMTPEMMASSGVGSLPVDNIGQNYAGGGIIAFEEGGEVEDDYGMKELGEDVAVEAGLMRLLGPAGMFLSPGEAKASTKYSDEELAKKLGYNEGGIINPYGTNPFDPMNPTLIRNKSPEEAKKSFANILGEDLLTKELPSEKMAREKLEQKETAPAPSLAPKQPKTPAKTMSDYRQEFMDMLGEDTTRGEMKERMAKLDKKAADREAQAPWLATMQAGLAMAAGSSPYALQNIAAGAALGVEKYGAEQEAMQAIEEKRLALLDDMAKADRAEKVAAIEYGMQSKQFEETQALKQSISNQETALKIQEIIMKQGTGRAKVAQEIIEAGEMNTWTEQFLADNGKDYANSPTYFNAYQAELGRRINERMRAGTSGQLFDTSTFLELGV